MSIQSHPSETHRYLRNVILIALFAALIAFAAFVVSARAWFTPHSPIKTSTSASADANLQQHTHQRSPMEAEIITITPLGFEPAEITRPKGAFFLVVDNRSGLEEITFRLDREAGQRQHEVRVPREQLDWDGVVDLHPGTYLLTEASHPDWLCRITITAQ